MTLTKLSWRKPWGGRLWNVTQTSIRLKNSRSGQKSSNTSNSLWKHLKMRKVGTFMMKSIFARRGPAESLFWWTWMEVCCANLAKTVKTDTQEKVQAGLTSVTGTMNFGFAHMWKSFWSLSCTQLQRLHLPSTQVGRWRMPFHKWQCSSRVSTVRILQDQLFAIFAGDEFSVPDPDAGPYKSKRSLPRIWKDVRTRAARGVKFDMCNTINLDNEISKIREHLENGIVVPNFGPRQIGSEDQILVELKEYLKCVAKECHGDVREYMKLFPFCKGGSASVRALPPMSTFEDAKDEDEVDRVTKQFEKVALGESEKPWVTFWMAIGPHHGAIAEMPVAFTVKAEITSRFLASDSSDLLQAMSLPLRFLTRCKDAKRTNRSCFDFKCFTQKQTLFHNFDAICQPFTKIASNIWWKSIQPALYRFRYEIRPGQGLLQVRLADGEVRNQRNPNERDFWCLASHPPKSPGSKRWRSGWWQITTLLRLGGLV